MSGDEARKLPAKGGVEHVLLCPALNNNDIQESFRQTKQEKRRFTSHFAEKVFFFSELRVFVG